MAEKTRIVQNPDGSQTIYVKPDVIGIFGEIAGCIGGLFCGGFVGVQVAKAIGPVATTMEKIGKAVLVGAAGTATEYYVSEGISGTFNDISDLADTATERIRKRTQKEVVAQEEVSQTSDKKTETKK